MVQKNKRHEGTKSPMVFGSFNYKLLVIGLVFVTAGFTAMYLENKVSGVISLYISPIVIIAGYVTVIFSIMMRPAQDHAQESHGAR